MKSEVKKFRKAHQLDKWWRKTRDEGEGATEIIHRTKEKEQKRREAKLEFDIEVPSLDLAFTIIRGYRGVSKNSAYVSSGQE